MTNSRGGWLALGVMVLAYMYLFTRYRKVGLVVGIVGVAVLFVLGPSRMASIGRDASAGRGRIAA